MSQPLLPHRRAEEFRARNRGGVPAEILGEAAVIVEGVRSGGEEALRGYTTRFEDCAPGAPLYLTKETLKRAMKAYRKRLKLARLNDESTSGRNPLSAGHKSAICAVVPPEQYPPDVWEQLAALGRLRALGSGLYELVAQ